MISALLIAAAAALLFGDKVEAWIAAHRDKLAAISGRKAAAAILVAVAVGWFLYSSQPIDDGRPTPAPGSVGELDLAGLFTGASAADDAAALAALCDELAAAVEFDGMAERPRLATGWQIADLRTAARDIRLRGETFGDRQPQVRDAVKAYLDRPEILGRDGGPLSPRDRSRWVAAFRDVARAAEAAIQ